jgi:plastocyanin
MRRASPRLPLLLACGLLALGMISAIALPAPAKGGHGRTVRARRCHLRTHSRHAVRHRDRCAASRRHRSRHGWGNGGSPPVPVGAVLPGETGTSSTGPISGGSAPEMGGAGTTTTPAPTPPPPSVPHVQVTAVEYRFTLSRTTVPAGRVIFDFVNDGQDEHNLNLLSGEGSIAGSLPNTPARSVRDQAVVLSAGSYVLFCSLPEHRQKGMRAVLLVR